MAGVGGRAGVGVVGAVDGQHGGWHLPVAAPAQPALCVSLL